MKILIALILGIAVAVGAIWYFGSDRDRERLDEAGDKIERSVRSAGDAIEEELREHDLTAENIKEELSKTGRVIREKSRKVGSAISDASADARITAAIKAKFVKDPELSALGISVNTTDGVVTLSGSVASVELVGKAMSSALETEGVQKVISTLQVKPKTAARE